MGIYEKRKTSSFISPPMRRSFAKFVALVSGGDCLVLNEILRFYRKAFYRTQSLSAAERLVWESMGWVVEFVRTTAQCRR
jgi:hypothetical protein